MMRREFWRSLLMTLTLLGASGTAIAQQIEPSRHRIAQVEIPGRRVELSSLKGAVLFIPPAADGQDRPPLVIHFHGAPWLVESHIAKQIPRSVLITVQLGSGSSVYGRPFQDTETFKAMIDEARSILKLKHDWSSITLTGFSAGYGAIRAILRNAEYRDRVENVLLLDGIHASYLPEGTPPVINAKDLDSFVEFARLAAAGKKRFVITHSAIVPGNYASTTECTSFLIDALGLRRTLSFRETATGMHQRSALDARGFHVRGYSGSTAADHVDHIHSMTEWFELLKF
jgi:hypothetical protein